MTGACSDGSGLVARVQALEAASSDLRLRVASLEAGHGPRDDADRRVVAALMPSLLGTTFTVAAVLRHARLVDPPLAKALRDADLTSAAELGHWLARMSGQRIGDVMIQRGPRGRSGRVWTLRPVC